MAHGHLCQTRLCHDSGGMLLGQGSLDDAADLVTCDLSGRCIRWVAPAPALALFTALADLNLSDNHLPNMACLAPLQALHTLRLPANDLSSLGSLPKSAFAALEHLDLAFNQLKSNPVGMHGLAALPNLRHLNLSGEQALLSESDRCQIVSWVISRIDVFASSPRLHVVACPALLMF